MVPGGGVELEPLLWASEPAGEILSEQRESKDLYVPESISKSWCREGESNPQGPKPGGFCHSLPYTLLEILLNFDYLCTRMVQLPIWE